jgi:hypothetical protein
LSQKAPINSPKKNTKEAEEVWRRMQSDAGGKAPPEILSTHPL